jgi:hypothetical protein
VRHVFSLIENEMHGENLESASALYVPLLHYPTKTAAKQPTSGGLRPLESAACGCKKRLTMPDKGSFSLIVSAAMRE